MKKEGKTKQNKNHLLQLSKESISQKNLTKYVYARIMQMEIPFCQYDVPTRNNLSFYICMDRYRFFLSAHFVRSKSYFCKLYYTFFVKNIFYNERRNPDTQIRSKHLLLTYYVFL